MLEGKILNNRFKVKKRLHQSQYNEIYKGVDLTCHEKIAVKIQLSDESPSLFSQIPVMQALQGQKGFCDLISNGTFEGKQYLILEYTSKSLQKELFNRKTFSQGCIFRIAEELLRQIMILHNSGIIHGNLNLNHILCGYGRYWQNLYIVDFSNSIFTSEFETLKLQKYDLKNELFLPIKALKNEPLSYKDDLISVAYILVYLWTGTLPWKNSKIFKIEDEILFREKFSVQEITQNCPEKFFNFLHYCKNLSETTVPDYEMLKGMLKGAAREIAVIRHFDWIWHHQKMVKKCKFSRKNKIQNKRFEYNDEIRKNKSRFSECFQSIFVIEDIPENILSEKISFRRKSCRESTKVLEKYPEFTDKLTLLNK